MQELQISAYRISLEEWKRMRRGGVITVARPGLIPFVLMLDRDALGAESSNGAGDEASAPVHTRPPSRATVPPEVRARILKAILKDGTTAAVHTVPAKFGYPVRANVVAGWFLRGRIKPKLTPACQYCKKRFAKIQQLGRHIFNAHKDRQSS